MWYTQPQPRTLALKYMRTPTSNSLGLSWMKTLGQICYVSKIWSTFPLNFQHRPKTGQGMGLPLYFHYGRQCWIWLSRYYWLAMGCSYPEDVNQSALLTLHVPCHSYLYGWVSVESMPQHDDAGPPFSWPNNIPRPGITYYKTHRSVHQGKATW